MKILSGFLIVAIALTSLRNQESSDCTYRGIDRREGCFLMTWTNKEQLATQLSYQIALTILENLAIYQNSTEEYHTRNLRKLELILMTTILQNNLGNL